MTEWIPVTERLPEVEEVVILCIRGAKRAKEGYLMSNGAWRVWGGTYQDHDAVTHWMPLPPAPEASDE